MKLAKKKYILLIILLLINCFGFSQSVGVSYLLPKKGTLSIPISPFAYTLPIGINDFFDIDISGSLYYIGGMSVNGLPEGMISNKPLLGPYIAGVGSIMPVLKIPFGRFELGLQGGVFGFYNFNPSLNNGNIDKMLIDTYDDIDIVNTDFTFDNNPGWGYIYGARLKTYLKKDLIFIVGLNYYDGGADFNMRGKYDAYSIKNNYYKNAEANYDETQIDFNGFEISLAIEF